MADPSDLVAHYSSQAFQTRIYALTFSGAVLGAVLTWERVTAESNLIGFALIVVVWSLGELNRRYAHSYLAACRTASMNLPNAPKEELTRIRWAYFSRINELPWSALGTPLYRAAPWRSAKKVFMVSWLKRFLLSWLTYVPGLVVGALVIYRGKISALGVTGWVIGFWSLASWINISRKQLDRTALDKLEDEIITRPSKSFDRTRR